MPANAQNCTKDDDGKRSLSNTDAVTVARIEAAILDLAVSRQNWSYGHTEGQINRSKILKRRMYGRANLDLHKTRLFVAA